MTTGTKFTPGPWKARHSSVIDVEKDEIIAVMTCGSVNRKNELEDYNTARFIAAAPKVYAALEAMVDRYAPSYHDCTDDGLPECEICEARAALAEARSES